MEVLDANGGERLEAITEDGECRMYAEPERGVTVWAEHGSRERVSEVLVKRVRPSDAKSDRYLGVAA